jgi:hypothetical protein
VVAGDQGRFARAWQAARRGGRSRDWFVYRRLPDRWSYLRWNGLFEFLVSPGGRRVQYQALARATADSFNTYLLGQVLSFSLLALGEEPLHGTAIVAGGRAIGFLGDCGSGKSTLGAAFLDRGFSLLTDDLLALDRTRAGYEAYPGIPRVKLYPRVSRKLLGVSGGPRMNHGTSKQVLPLDRHQACGHKVPLAALYVISRPPRGSSAIGIRTLSQSQALLEIVKYSFNTVVLDKGRLANQLTLASRLVTRVPVKRLTYPRRLASLPAVCEAVLADQSS